MTSAVKTAEILGDMLRLDPVVASMIQNTVPPAELIKLLGLDDYVAAQLAQVAKNSDPLEPLPEILRLAAEERRRQVSKEGFSSIHDDMHDSEELRSAAAVYAMPHHCRNYMAKTEECIAVRIWPWEMGDMKFQGPRRDMVKAIALLVAEDERLQRIES